MIFICISANLNLYREVKYSKHKKAASGCSVSQTMKADFLLLGRPSFGSVLSKKSVSIV